MNATVNVLSVDGKRVMYVGQVVAVRKGEAKVFAMGHGLWIPVGRLVPRTRKN